jgi:D-lactate dehydrogenase
MKIAIYSCHNFEIAYIEKANKKGYELVMIDDTLNENTLQKAKDCKVISIFSSDKVNREILKNLDGMGIELITTRSAGTDHIDLEAAEEFDIRITNVPEYSPNAIAEHCIALTLALYRKLKTSFQRIGEYNFSLDGQVGTEIHSKTVGICGTGDIGAVLANLFHGFGAKVLLFDAKENPDLMEKSWSKYVSKDTILKECDIVSLNLPLNENTEGFISADELNKMKKSAILINTGRGGLVNTKAVHDALQSNKIAGFAMDVYENEKGIFYKDLSNATDKDELLISLTKMDNVVVTAHQAFLTNTALNNMMETTFNNIDAFLEGKELNVIAS